MLGVGLGAAGSWLRGAGATAGKAALGFLGASRGTLLLGTGVGMATGAAYGALAPNTSVARGAAIGGLLGFGGGLGVSSMGLLYNKRASIGSWFSNNLGNLFSSNTISKAANPIVDPSALAARMGRATVGATSARVDPLSLGRAAGIGGSASSFMNPETYGAASELLRGTEYSVRPLRERTMTTNAVRRVMGAARLL